MLAASSQDFGSLFKAVGLYGDTMVAAGAGDNTERTTDAVDTNGFASGEVIVTGRTTCAVGETLKLTLKVAEADDDGSGSPGAFGADATLVDAAVILNGSASAQAFAYEKKIDLTASRKRWLKFKLTLDLSAGGVDVCQWGSALILGGAKILPAK